MSEIDSQKTESIDQDRIDARRYRWMRDNDPYLWEELCVSNNPQEQDATVDWAMAGGCALTSAL